MTVEAGRIAEGASAGSQNGVPEYNATQEVRFAVVIYGGVSLAIYINGIVQEMLRLVQSTAPAAPVPNQAPRLIFQDGSGSRRVYRKLGQLLGSADGSPVELARRLGGPHEPPISTRFVIDILSGTSAGGINAVFLAKGLVSQQDIKPLETTWIREGDIKTLINDGQSLGGADNRLTLRRPTKSLLNGQRMYLKLLQALDDMDSGGEPGSADSLVEQLDLFCTATDLAGLRLTLPLADSTVEERRHRSVFRFRFEAPDDPGSGAAADDCPNDFQLKDNPFLAFAARCTSAFPFAFEPMTLADIFPVLESAPRHRGKAYSDPQASAWKRFYDDYLEDPEKGSLPFEKRAFGDGGYLDNKPFSYAIQTVLRRQADLPVERKLVYIEPDPEQLRPAETAPPDAIANTLDALVVLPRDETIREDLELVVRRNTEIERIKRVLRDINPELLKVPTPVLGGADWVQQTKEQTLHDYGVGYVAYERLKLSDTTDQLTRMVCRAFRIDAKSGYFNAVRMLIGRWRDQKKYGYGQERQFMLDFDVAYRVRRLVHVVLYIKELLDRRSGSEPEGYDAELRRLKRRLRVPRRSLESLLERDFPELGAGKPFPIGVSQLSFVLSPEARGPHPEPRGRALETGEEGMKARADLLLAEHSTAIEQLADETRRYLTEPLKKISAETRAILAADESHSAGARLARQQVRERYGRFELYDLVTFPITFGCELGEGETIAIHRISPEDPKARLAEAPPTGSKLKGAALGAFGGFLDSKWRENDILWGRLDGSERLIEMLLPGGDEPTRALRGRLVEEAHGEIVQEFLHEHGFVAPQPGLDWKQQLRAYFATIPAEPARDLVATSAARSTTVAAGIFEAIAEKRQWEKRPFGWLATVGQLAWGIVEISVPRSIWVVFFRHALKLLFLFGLFVTVVGAFAGGSLAVIGVLITGAVVVLALVQASLEQWLRREPPLSAPSAVAFSFVASVVIAALLFMEPTVRTFVGRQIPELAGGELLAWLDRAALAGLVVTALSGLLTMLFWLKIEGPPKGSRTPGWSLRVARSWAEVRRALGDRDGSTRRQLRAFGWVSPLLIGGYMFVALAIGARMAVDGHSWGYFVILFGLLTGVVHLWENRAVLALTEQDTVPSPEKDATTPFSPAAWPRFALRWAIVALLLGTVVLGPWNEARNRPNKAAVIQDPSSPSATSGQRTAQGAVPSP